MRLVAKICLILALAWAFGKVWYWSLAGFAVYKLYATYLFKADVESADLAEFCTMLLLGVCFAWAVVWGGARIFRKLGLMIKA